MSTPSFSSRVLDAGAALRVPRPAWAAGGPAAPRRLALLVLVGIAGVLAIVYLTLRLTPLSTVERVTVVGVQGPDAPAIRHAIERAALGQSTLGFADGAVEQAVADSASITGVTVHAKFPHAVQVEVQQRLAVGAVESGGRRVAVSADGHLLPDWDVGDLPLIRGARTERGGVTGVARDATAILGGAPAALLAHVARVDGGTTVRIADGPALLFRDTHRLNAKWAAAVAVLNDAGTRGATWIDLRVPEQPVAGKGAPPTLPRAKAKVGRVPPTADALATAERGIGDTPTAPSATTAQRGGASADSAAATAAQAAPATTASTTAAPATATTSAPSTGGTPSTDTSSTPDSGAASPAATSEGAGTSSTASGGGTAPTAQTTP